MVNIETTNDKIKVNLEQLKTEAQKVLGLLDYADFELNIVLTNNQTLRAYNKKYRGVDKPTDILSFRYWPKANPDKLIVPLLAEDKQLGDLIISLEYVEGQLKEFNQTMDERIRVLVVHGICHLIGYDHKTDEDYKKMKDKEDWILAHL